MQRLSQRGRQTQKWSRLVIASSFAAVLSVAIFLVYNLSQNEEATASPATETIASGSFIVNMGVTPQTVANGLKPYGLIWDLIENYQVPIKWVIEPSKTKDGIDFTHNGVNYRGGTFIVPADFINPTISTLITSWQAQGVVGDYSVSSISVPVYMTITNYPRVMVDVLSGNDPIIDAYYANAGIPSSGYFKGTPADLDVCYDLWANPHGDPTWATHSNLHNFVTTHRSYIWSQCHAVSMLEDVIQPAAPFQQLNFLSNSGLQCYSNNKCLPIAETHSNIPSAPYTYYYPTDPVMQFMSTATGAMTSNGSEKWFIPVTTGSWRTNTKRLCTTGTGTSPREGVLMVYGPAYGDYNNGLVMYQGGHDMSSGTTTEMVAAQRAFHNFCLLAGKARELLFTSSDIPTSFTSGETFPVSVTVTSGVPAYTYQWTSSIGGTFADPNAASTTFTAPIVSAPTSGIIRCIVTDACGRVNFITQTVSFGPAPLPVTLLDFTAEPLNNSEVITKWSTGTEKNNDYFTLEKSVDGNEFVPVARIEGAGNSSSVQNYSYTDKEPYKGTSYYRLTQIDYDGKFKTYHAVPVHISNSLIKDLTIYPNPFNNNFVAEFHSENEEEIWIQVININGALVHSEQTISEKGHNVYRFTAPVKLAEGTYIFKLKNSKDILATERLILKK